MICHKDTSTSSLQILTLYKYLPEAQWLWRGSPITRADYLCTPLDPKLLAALFVQAPPGPQAFHSGWCPGAMKGLYAERRQKPWEGWISSSLITYNVRYANDRNGTGSNCNCGSYTRRCTWSVPQAAAFAVFASGFSYRKAKALLMRVQQSVIPLVWNCSRLNCWPKNNQPANGGAWRRANDFGHDRSSFKGLGEAETHMVVKLKRQIYVLVILMTGYCPFHWHKAILCKQHLCCCWRGTVIPRATSLLQSPSLSFCSSGKCPNGKKVKGTFPVPHFITAGLFSTSLYMLIRMNMSQQKQQQK